MISIWRVKVIYILLCTLCSSLLANKEIDFNDFKSFQTQEGLSSINTICRDFEGFLWVGGNETLGLVRFDGTEEYHYKRTNNQLNQLAITKIFEDHSQRLWIGTINGLYLYNRETDTFQPFKHIHNNPNTILDNYIRSIYEDNQHRLWIITPSGLNHYQALTDSFLTYPINSSSMNSGNEVTDMVADHQNRVWVVGKKEGIYQFDEETKTFSYIPDNRKYHNFNVNSLFVDSSGYIWIASRGMGISRFNPNTQTFRHFTTNGDGTGTNGSMAWDMIEYPKNQMLFAINQGGLNRYNMIDDTFIYENANKPKRGNISSNGITTLYLDDESILWLGMSRVGIDYLNPKNKRFKTYTHTKGQENFGLINDVVSCFMEDSDGLVWIGTDGGGISIWNRKTQEFLPIFDESMNGPLSSGVIRSMKEDQHGRIWVSTWDSGINIFEKKNGKISRYSDLDQKLKTLSKDKLWQCYIDTQNRIWITFSSGQVHLFDENMNLLHLFNFYELTRTPFINEDKHGVIYLQNQGGFYVYSEKEFEFKQIVKKESGCSILKASDGIIYAGTYNHGVQIFTHEGNPIKSIATEDGLDDDSVKSIEEGLDGIIWISTTTGINSYNHKTEMIQNFSSQDGIQNRHFFSQSSIVLKSGELCFGGNSGFTVIDPKHLEINPYIPKVYVTEISINNEPVDFTLKDAAFQASPKSLKELKLNAKQNFIDFRFSAVNFTNSKKNQYAYQMEGVDKNWIYTNSKNRTASYKNLQPGEYVFKVIGSNNDGIWNKKGATIKVTITPPFTQTTAFYSLIMIGSILIIAFVFIVWQKKLLKDKQLLEIKVTKRTETIRIQQEELLEHKNHLEKLVRERTQELQIAKDKAEHSDLLKTRFIANMSHEIRTPLNAIVSLSNFLNDPHLELEDRTNFTASINENSDSLLNLIEDILFFSMLESNQIKATKETFLINDFIQDLYEKNKVQRSDSNGFVLQNDLISDDIELTSAPIRIQKIMNNLLHNAFKFSKNGAVQLGVKLEEKKLQLYVQDDGPGISENDQKDIFDEFVKVNNNFKSGIGLGLAISKRLAHLLNASLGLESEPGKGTRFTLTFNEISFEKNN